MGDKEREEFLKTIDVVINESFNTDTPLTRVSETEHTICHGQEVFLQIYEAGRLIEIKKPYYTLPESLRRLVDHGKKAGYRIHE